MNVGEFGVEIAQSVCRQFGENYGRTDPLTTHARLGLVPTFWSFLARRSKSLAFVHYHASPTHLTSHPPIYRNTKRYVKTKFTMFTMT